ncbi:MAG: hypothetical protein JWN63_2750, partial [Candidatus Acidoferrum typicum]|nr:hypothetical protein [Candidatus Acidoferrum typicum]
MTDKAVGVMVFVSAFCMLVYFLRESWRSAVSPAFKADRGRLRSNAGLGETPCESCNQNDLHPAGTCVNLLTNEDRKTVEENIYRMRTLLENDAIARGVNLRSPRAPLNGWGVKGLRAMKLCVLMLLSLAIGGCSSKPSFDATVDAITRYKDFQTPETQLEARKAFDEATRHGVPGIIVDYYCAVDQA